MSTVSSDVDGVHDGVATSRLGAISDRLEDVVSTPVSLRTLPVTEVAQLVTMSVL